MNADPNPAKAIFLEAVEQHDPDGWPAFLDQACAGQPELRRRVEVLLGAHREAGTAPHDPAAECSAPVPIDVTDAAERPGTVIGPYKLLQQIGEGGMGTVFMAEQTHPVQRKVALKVIKPGMDSRQVIARFEAERQALAMMDHVNIARVFDAGTIGEPGALAPGLGHPSADTGGSPATGRPYFVMELVHGVPITKYCDDNRLTPRERLELFMPVCQAIQHAHQKGIIHRDIKPSNVMITLYDGKPVPKVIDFGVAKATEQKLTERTLFTQYGTLVGTLEYMSPEQAEMSALGVDTRSDIYSLGVLLYELLTGSTPLSHKRLKEAAYAEILRMIREEEPPKPSTRLSDSGEALASISANRHTEPAKLTKLVKGELDWIVMKTLEKDRNRRYETAKDFAADVQRYLRDEPVLACPPSTSYRLAKFVRRNKAGVIAAGLVLLALVAGVVGTSFGLARALDAEKTARTAEEHERQAKLQAVDAKREAERNLGQALKAADTFFTRVSESKLLDKPALQPFRKELLEEAQKQYLELFNKKPDDAKLKAELGASYLRMVIVLAALEEGPQAVQALEKGLDLIEPLIQEHPGDRELVKRLAGVCTAERPMFRGWADGLSRSNMRNGLKTLERACALWKKLADDYPDLAELQGDHATLLMYQGDICFGQERYRECQRLYEAADARFSKLLRVSSQSSEYRIHAAFARTGVAWHLQYFGHVREAIEKHAESIRMFEDLQREFPKKAILQLGILGAQGDTVESLNWMSRPQEAIALENRVIQSAEELFADHPDVPAHAIVLSYMYGTRASAEESKGRMQVAEAEFRKSLEALEKTAAYYPDHPRVQAFLASQYGGLGMFHLRRGDAIRALQLTEQALSILHKLGAAAADDESVLLQLGALYLQRAAIDKGLGRLEHAEKAYRAAITNQSRFLRQYSRSLYFSPDLYGSCAGLYDLLKSSGRTREADEFIRQTIADWEKLARDDPEKYEFELQVAQSHALAGKWDKSVEEYSKAISKWPHRVDLWRGRASAYSNLGKHDQAVRDYTTLIDFGYRAPAFHHWMYEARANAYRALKQDDKALADLSQATEQWPFLLDPWLRRGDFYRERNRWPEALDDYAKAMALNSQRWDAWHHRGIAHAGLKEWAKAVADQTKAIELSPTPHLWNWHQRGLCHAQLKQWHAALSDFMKVVELEPNQALGLVYHLQAAKRSEEATQLLRQSIEVLQKAVADPSNDGKLQHLGQCWRTLAHVLDKSERQKDSEAALNRAIDIFAKLAKEEPQAASHRNLLGWSRVDLGVQQLQYGETDAAERSFRQAIELWTKLPADAPADPAYLLHAVNVFLHHLRPLLQETGRSVEAEQFVARAIPEWTKLARDDREDHRNALADATGLWARLLVDLGKRQEAEQLAAKIEQWPDNAHALIARGRIRLALGQPDKALEDFEKATRLAPKDGMAPWWWLDRSYAHAALKQEDKALVDLTEAIERWPELWDAWVWRGNFHFDRQRWHEAVADYTKALALNPQYAPAWHRRGLAASRLADWDRAIQDYDKAIALHPKNAGLRHELAWLLAHCPDQKVRSPQRAVELARRAVGLDPKNGAYRGTLGSARYRAGDWKAAIEELSMAIKLRGNHGADMLFLAMAHKRLDQDAEARGWYDRAIEWLEKNAPKDDELRRFRDEARELLKLKD